MGWRKKPLALPSAVSTTYSGPTASSSSHGRDTAVEPNGGWSFTAASALATGLSGGGVIRACLYLVGSPKDELRLRLRLLLGPWPDSSMSQQRAPSVIVSAQRQNLSLCGIALDHRPQYQKWGSSLSLARLGSSCSYTHTYIQQACPCRPWNLWRCPEAAISASSSPGIGGPSRSLWLELMAATPGIWDNKKLLCAAGQRR